MHTPYMVDDDLYNVFPSSYIRPYLVETVFPRGSKRSLGTQHIALHKGIRGVLRTRYRRKRSAAGKMTRNQMPIQEAHEKSAPYPELGRVLLHATYSFTLFALQLPGLLLYRVERTFFCPKWASAICCHTTFPFVLGCKLDECTVNNNIRYSTYYLLLLLFHISHFLSSFYCCL